MKLIVRQLTPNDESAFREALLDWKEEGIEWISFEWRDGMHFADLVERLNKNRLGVGLPSGFVPSTALYGFLGERIIGRCHIRHQLNTKLLHRGGHIGYAVAKPFRQKGLGFALLEAGLHYCRSLGLPKVLITCGDENIPSARMIEKCGGQLENTVWDDEDQEPVRRYWITLESL